MQETYDIYMDASWNDKYGVKSMGAYIVYLDGKKIIEETNRFTNRPEGISPEYLNFIKTLNSIYKNFYKRNKIQIFNFYSDCNNLIEIVSSMLKYKIYKQYLKDTNINDKLYSTVMSYKNSIKVKHIPRELNIDANKLATESYENYLYEQNMINATAFMKNQLIYDLNTWKKHFGLEHKEAQINIKKLEEFIKTF